MRPFSFKDWEGRENDLHHIGTQTKPSLFIYVALWNAIDKIGAPACAILNLSGQEVEEGCLAASGRTNQQHIKILKLKINLRTEDLLTWGTHDGCNLTVYELAMEILEEGFGDGLRKQVEQ